MFNDHPTLGFLLYGVSHPFGVGLWRGGVQAARDYDANFVCFAGGTILPPVSPSGYGFDAQANILYELIDQDRFDGLVICSNVLLGQLKFEEFEKFCARYHPLPMVSIGVPLEGSISLEIDNYAGMYEAVNHLITEHGYRRIAFIQGSENSEEAKIRYRAYTDALAENAIVCDPALVTPGDFCPPAGEEAIRLLIDERRLQPGRNFDAIVSANDTMAFTALAALQARGFEVPHDVAMVGFDDTEQARAATPSLTTVRLSSEELGYQATRMLIDRIQGKDLSERRSVATRLIVRQSCGCVEPNVTQATAGVVTASQDSLETEIAERQDAIVAEIVRHGNAHGANLDSEGVAPVVEGFIEAVQGKSEDAFLSALDRGIRQVIRTEGDVSVWQNVLSSLRRNVLASLSADETGSTLRDRAENLWHQARVMIAEATKRVQTARLIHTSERTATLREVGSRLINTFDVATLMDILAEELPRLGIQCCYLSVYESPHSHSYLQPAPEWSHVILAYNEHGRIAIEPNGHRFPSRHLIPEDIVALDDRYNLVAAPLYFQEKQLGIVIFGATPQAVNPYDSIYKALQEEISSALQGALLVKQVREHAHELAAASEEIRILNGRLQEENLRMGAELDIARRLQTMVLPQPEELQHISTLDIAGYMQPADEVGGDYYDVLKKDGLLHIGIGDVTGHGLESGVLMLMTQTAIRTLIEHGETDPIAFVNTLNRTIYKNTLRMQADKTLTFSLVNYQNGQLKLVGQHEDLLVVRKGGIIERIDTTNLGFPIGLQADISEWIASQTITIQPGDGIVLYTDGIPEAANPQQELYGMERLCTMISHNWQHSANAIQQAVVDDVTRFIGVQTVYDDLTLVIMKQL